MDIVGFILGIGWVPALCFFAGLILVIIEIFNPGFGFPGIGGIVLLILSVVLSADTVAEAFVMIIVIFIILGIAVVLVLRSADKGRLSRTLVLSSSMKKRKD
jgi:membrane-bound ClpP family serine protease